MTTGSKPGTVIRNPDGTTTILNFRFGHGERYRLADPRKVPYPVMARAADVVLKTREVECRHWLLRAAWLNGDDYAADLLRADWEEAETAARLASDACRGAIDDWDCLAVVLAGGCLLWLSEHDRRILNVVRADCRKVCSMCAGHGEIKYVGEPESCPECGGEGMKADYVPKCVKPALESVRERREARFARWAARPRSATVVDSAYVSAVDDAARCQDIPF